MQKPVTTHNSDDLIALFNGLFADTYNTLLVHGGSEPLYRPAKSGAEPAQIVFAYDYFSSALHEVAHWCLAGERRRQLVDYGYWYHEDGRCAGVQAKFEQVEIKPQALEWLFSAAAGCRFRISLDNLDGSPHDEVRFKTNLVSQAQAYLAEGLPERGELFMKALLENYARQISAEYFSLDQLP